MYTTTDYLEQLVQEKQDLVDNLNAQGVEATSSETFTTLIPKVLDIETGTDILNGVIEQYKAYTTENNVTVSAGTFIEFIRTTSSNNFTNGIIRFIEEYDNNTLFIIYRTNTALNCALIRITNVVTIVNEQQISTDSVNSNVFGYIKENNSYIVNLINKLIKITVNNDNSFTLSNNLSVSQNYYNIVLVKDVTTSKYYAGSYFTGGQWYIQLFKIENNVISLVGSAVAVFNFGTIYSSQGGDMYVSNDKLLILASTGASSATSYKFYSFANETLTEEATGNFSSKNNMISKMLNNKLYLIFTNNGLFIHRYTVDFTNNTIVSDSNDVQLLESTEYTQFGRIENRKLFLIDKLYLFYATNTTESSLLEININTLQPITHAIISGMSVQSTLQTFASYISICYFVDKFIYAKVRIEGGTSYNESIIYNVDTDGGISEGETFVTPSVSKIEGLTKTDCTNLVAGDVWVLNQE